jgi:hypothetical protein
VDGFFVCDFESQNCCLAILRIEDILPLYACVDKKIVFKYFFSAKLTKNTQFFKSF